MLAKNAPSPTDFVFFGRFFGIFVENDVVERSPLDELVNVVPVGVSVRVKVLLPTFVRTVREMPFFVIRTVVRGGFGDFIFFDTFVISGYRLSVVLKWCRWRSIDSFVRQEVPPPHTTGWPRAQIPLH